MPHLEWLRVRFRTRRTLATARSSRGLDSTYWRGFADGVQACEDVVRDLAVSGRGVV